MKLTIDTETDTLDDLQNTLSIITKAIEKKGVKSAISSPQEVQQQREKVIANNPHARRIMEQERLMKTIDLTPILQSDYGINKRRSEMHSKRFNK